MRVSWLALLLITHVYLVGCASQAIPNTRTHIGIGKDRLAIIADSVLRDLRIFFSQQLVFQREEDCPVRIMLEAQKLENESAERIDFSRLVQALRTQMLNPRSADQLNLAGRSIMLIHENRQTIAGKPRLARCLPAQGKKSLGADYVLAGRIISEDKINQQDIRQKQTLINFWLLDLETGAKAWTSKPYLFKTIGQNDVVYR